MTIDQMKAAIVARVNECLLQGFEVYGISFAHVGISFDLRGRSAGQALQFDDKYHIRFNMQMITNGALENFLNEIVPHEVAHLYCFAEPKLGAKHDAGWEAVCLLLGGTGKSKHSNDWVYANGHTYHYTSTSGAVQKLSQIRHNRIQQGRIYQFKDGGIVTKHCAHSIVKHHDLA